MQYDEIIEDLAHKLVDNNIARFIRDPINNHNPQLFSKYRTSRKIIVGDISEIINDIMLKVKEIQLKPEIIELVKSKINDN